MRAMSGSAICLDFAVAGQFAAYKCLPIRPINVALCISAARDPNSKSFRGVNPITQIFGSTAAVLSYSVLSRIISSLENRIFGWPVVGDFDDFGFIVPSGVS